MAGKRKKSIPQKTRDFKINTRIIITSVLAIVIPILILAIAACIFVFTSMDRYDFTSVNTESYNVVNQIQWSQTVNNIAAVLAGDDEESEKLEKIKETADRLEAFGSILYIERNSELYYSTTDPDLALKEANEIAPINKNVNSYYYGESGIVIVNTATDHDLNYTIIAANNNYSEQDNSAGYASQHILASLTNNATVVMGVCVFTFVAAIIVISLITSKTIIGPIEKITEGANEIAKGNLDYEIDYQSANELGQLTRSFNDMRLRVKESIESKNRADQQQKEMIAGIAHDMRLRVKESIESKNRADQQQKEMIAGIAHDLRTPLTSIKGYLEGIRDGVADTPEKQKRYLETIYDSAVSMEKMLNDLLTLSKLELGNITLNQEKVKISDFTSFAYEIGEELKKNDFEFTIKNNTKTDPVLLIDTDRFARVVDNIISNSIKYRRKNVRGKIELIISEYDHSVIFEIADNGMGVDKESLTRIFDTLYRADNARSNVSDGSGLGLAVCRQIVELHGGMIWAQTNAENGLSIFISLPKTEEPEEDKNEKNSDH